MWPEQELGQGAFYDVRGCGPLTVGSPARLWAERCSKGVQEVAKSMRKARIKSRHRNSQPSCICSLSAECPVLPALGSEDAAANPAALAPHPSFHGPASPASPPGRAQRGAQRKSKGDGKRKGTVEKGQGWAWGHLEDTGRAEQGLKMYPPGASTLSVPLSAQKRISQELLFMTRSVSS